jgi:TrmH family RNA methyltransferase
MASLARVKIYETELNSLFEKHKNLPVYGAVLDGKSIYEIKQKEKGILLIGNEGRGIAESLQSYITHKITIPGSGGADSLNAAISAGIISAWACEG